jgi:hypothetical protein
LAQAAVLLTLAVGFWLLTLRAAVFGGSGSGTHERTVARASSRQKMTLVTEKRFANFEIE